MFFQMRERFAQDRHVRQMERHVLESFRRRFSLEECNRDIVVPDRDAVPEFELLAQTEDALKPSRTFLWIAHCQTEMANDAELERNFHFHISNHDCPCQKRTHRNM